MFFLCATGFKEFLCERLAIGPDYPYHIYMQSHYPRNNYPKALAMLKQAFHFPIPAQRAMISDFIDQLEAGLAGQESMLKMIPTYMPLPTGREEGYALAIDMGGTNLRVMVVRLSRWLPGPEIIRMSKYEMSAAEMSRDAHTLFARIAREVNSLLLKLTKQDIRTPSLENTGFTFSYPVKMMNPSSGTIVNLAKELTASGLVGEDPFDLLFREFKNIKKQSRYFPLAGLRPMALVNDTVTELIYGSYLKLLADSPCKCRIGGIIGTGNNFALVLETKRIQQFIDPSYPYDHMIINMESGNFDADSLPKTGYDDLVDAKSNNRGCQRLEKMIAGNYLGKIAAAVMQDLARAGYLFNGRPAQVDKLDTFTCVHMSEMETALPGDREGARAQLTGIGIDEVSDTELDVIFDVITLVSGRAAVIAGTNVAAILKYLDPQVMEKHTVAIDGSVFGKYPGYQAGMRQTLAGLFRNKADRIRLEYIPDGSGIGAAIAASREPV